MRHRADLVVGALDVVGDLDEPGAGVAVGGRVGGELEPDPDRDQLLLDTVVEVALELATLLVGRSPRRTRMRFQPASSLAFSAARASRQPRRIVVELRVVHHGDGRAPVALDHRHVTPGAASIGGVAA